MFAHKRWSVIFALLMLPLQYVEAIQLDCQDNGDGTYFCVKIDPIRDADGSATALSEAVKSNNPYIEEAKKECSYQKPRRVGSAVGSHAALNREKEKSARQEYERCLAKKAHELKKTREK